MFKAVLKFGALAVLILIVGGWIFASCGKKVEEMNHEAGLDTVTTNGIQEKETPLNELQLQEAKDKVSGKSFTEADDSKRIKMLVDGMQVSSYGMTSYKPGVADDKQYLGAVPPEIITLNQSLEAVLNTDWQTYEQAGVSSKFTTTTPDRMAASAETEGIPYAELDPIFGKESDKQIMAGKGQHYGRIGYASTLNPLRAETPKDMYLLKRSQVDAAKSLCATKSGPGYDDVCAYTEVFYGGYEQVVAEYEAAKPTLPTPSVYDKAYYKKACLDFFDQGRNKGTVYDPKVQAPLFACTIATMWITGETYT